MAQTAPDILDSKLTMFRQDGNIKHLLDAMDKYSKQQNAEYIEALRSVLNELLDPVNNGLYVEILPNGNWSARKRLEKILQKAHKLLV